MSERTPMEALRSALRFAASRSCITSAEELAIMDAWNNTRPQPSAEPVAYAVAEAAYSAGNLVTNDGYYVTNDGYYEFDLDTAAAVIASALEAARREALEQAARRVECELAMTAMTNAEEASADWIDGFEHAWKRVKTALKENPNAG